MALVLAILGFALRLGLAGYFGLNHPPTPGSDEQEYDIYSWNLAQGRGFRGPSADVADPDHLTAWRVPGTSLVWAPLYLAFGHRYDVIRVFNCIVGAISVWLVYEIGRQCYSAFVGLLAAVAYAGFPTALIFTVGMLSEPLGTLWFLSFIFLSLLFAERPRWSSCIGAGLSLGMAILTRPNCSLMVPLVTCWVIWQFRGNYRTLIQACSIPVLAVCVLAPWAFRNYFLFHEFIPIATSSGSGLLQGNNNVVVSEPKYFGYSVWDTSIPEYRDILKSAGTEVERDRRARRLAIQWLRNNPDKWWFMIRHKFWRSWTPFLQPHTPALYRIAMLVAWGPTLVLFGLAYFPTLVLCLRRQQPGWLLHLAILQYVLTSIIFFAFLRYRQQIEPLCIILAATAVEYVSVWLHRISHNPSATT
jgi:4-amino-4-deoxy-L-arabinose transferase-like glycosyltransferase